MNGQEENMAKLNQIVAVVAGKKTRTEKAFGDLNKVLQKADLFTGVTRRYEPLEENGETLPPEEKIAQKAVHSVIGEARALLTDIMDAIATQEYGNTEARGVISIDGEKLLDDMPVTTLLYLEKQLNDLNTFVGNMPTLDSSERWTPNAQDGNYVTEPVKTHRTKKTVRPVVLYPATPEHPAQTQLVQEDILAGYWVTVKSSAAIPAVEKQAMQARIGKLVEAVRMAREQANSVDATNTRIAAPVLNYIFGI